MGRDRSVSLSPAKMKELGQEMVDYVTENQKTILHLSEWYTIKKRFTYNEWKTFYQRPEFKPYAEQAAKIIGMKYLDKNSNVRDGIAHRWLRLYFRDLRDYEDAQAELEAARKAAALKGEAQAIEQEKLKVLEEIQKGKKEPQK